MVAINLLPDIRQAKLRDEHRRRLTVGLGILICVIVLIIVAVQLILLGAQSVRISNLRSQVGSRQSQLENIPNLLTALTAQQALGTLPGLYTQRTYYTHLFSVLSTLQPSGLTLQNLSDGGNGALTISGAAGSYTEIALFVKALTTGTTATKQFAGGDAPFQTVTITSASASQNQQITFALNAVVNKGVLSHGQQ